MYVRNSDPSIPRVPTDINTSGDQPYNPTDHTIRFIFGKFISSTTEEQVSEGTVGFVTGTLVIPRLYLAYLDKVDYFDPFYPAGYKFVKQGAVPDEEGLFIYQKVKSTFNPKLGEVST
jgi:hypothetical protein